MTLCDSKLEPEFGVLVPVAPHFQDRSRCRRHKVSHHGDHLRAPHELNHRDGKPALLVGIGDALHLTGEFDQFGGLI